MSLDIATYTIIERQLLQGHHIKAIVTPCPSTRGEDTIKNMNFVKVKLLYESIVDIIKLLNFLTSTLTCPFLL